MISYANEAKEKFSGREREAEDQEEGDCGLRKERRLLSLTRGWGGLLAKMLKRKGPLERV